MRKLVITWLPVLSAIFAIAVDVIAVNAGKHPAAKQPYFIYLLAIILVVFTVGAAASYFNARAKAWIEEKSLFVAVTVLFLNLLNLVTKKLALLPVIYFPSLDKVIGVIVEDRAFLALCLASSGKLLFTGYVFGVITGIATGIAVGFSKGAAYWINPLIRTLGPIPPTAWIPLVLISFPTTFSASAFLIALAVWFPTAVLTSSGILNVQNAYFEVSSTLGAGKYYQIFRVGVPAAMPHMFIGLFNGTCASFITLMTAEMLGVKNGIGWYINWQKEMMAYANVYAGLIIIAITFSVLISLLFKVRDQLLVWQKGVIKW
ncbi:ABC transporter permease subunit|uniref:NitT/TauT family transport system permease protein n=1 Tax=Dendrosporobacter quercicolus TaxID=146817 RepID=A0A1G9S0V9_9FIRM|nr:ABC transporter permease subunit [Dendrosporobacter quercicolus]NSL49499.1 ABC transporter permease subunit [Dendrosporobacter quercicolus DSM 1736]SDM29188.1 NitT/TauT family transport system permease protein [Dendrosporobacter quercicolus]